MSAVKREKYEKYWSRRVKANTAWKKKFEGWIKDKSSRKVQAAILDYLNVATVLDVGCGLAYDYAFYKSLKLPIVYYGADITPEFLDEVKDKYPKLAENDRIGRPRLYYCRGQELPIPDSSFDVVSCRHLLEHVPNPRLIVREMNRVSKKWVMITWFHLQKSTRIDHIVKGERRALFNNYYSRKSSRRMIEKIGLELVKQKRVRHEAVWLCRKG